jgi:protein-S-isoprenylcysteine O-methyltransferase Ste14
MSAPILQPRGLTKRYGTARVEERENLRNFGAQYADSMRETRMFIPLVL